jgi:hypothetical protein
VNASTRQHTPGPWKVMPCPQHHGQHPFHDSRWISTEDAEVEYGDDHRPDQWCLGKGSLICEMRDGPPANARLLASAPELLSALADCLAFWDAPPTGFGCPTSRRKKLEAIQRNARAAIAKATGGNAS